MTPRQTGNALLHFLEAFADLCILSVYWLVCCVPVATIAASSAALYHTALKVVRQEKGSLTATFFRAFRETIKQGIVPSLLFAAGCGLIFVYTLLSGGISSEGPYFVAYWAVVIVLAAIFAGTFVYVFPLLSRFREKTRAILRTGFYLGAGYPIRTLGLLCLLAASALAVWKAPLLMLLMPGAFAFLASFIQEPILAKHTAGKHGPGN